MPLSIPEQMYYVTEQLPYSHYKLQAEKVWNSTNMYLQEVYQLLYRDREISRDSSIAVQFEM